VTVVVAAKVYEGLVVGADSITSGVFFSPNTAGQQVLTAQTYDNVNKVVNLFKGLPIGLATWGDGSIGTVSIATLAKDLRLILTDGSSSVAKINRKGYSIESVAKSAKEFFWGKFKAAYPNLSNAPVGPIGFLIFGLSSGADHAEAWLFEIRNGAATAPASEFSKAEDGIKAFGQSETTSRIIAGFDEKGLKNFLVAKKSFKPNDADALILDLKQSIGWKLHHPSMPIQDVVDLTKSLVQITSDCSRFRYGPQTVGGPIDLAVVTKHEGFKWIQRKFYYDSHLNPEEQRK